MTDEMQAKADEGPAPPRVAYVRQGATATVRLLGDWRLPGPLPAPPGLADGTDATTSVRELLVDAHQLEGWDSRFVVWLARFEAMASRQGLVLRHSGLPDGVRRLLRLAAERARVPTQPPAAAGSLAERVGSATLRGLATTGEAIAFLGELARALGRLVSGRACFDGRTFLLYLQRCGVDALPVVGLIGLLAGVVLAFVGAAQLERFGAELYVANLVTLGMAREMGALMAAIIVAGRTGAAFAAELASMKTNEEIDAFLTLGLDPAEYLVLPRLLALVLMMPLLAIYAVAIGMVGGALSATALFDLSLVQYYEQSLAFLDLADFWTGLGKAALYGWLVGYAGCFRGMAATRSAEGVGAAATSAVVLGVVLIVFGDALMTVIYYVLDV